MQLVLGMETWFWKFNLAPFINTPLCSA